MSYHAEEQERIETALAGIADTLAGLKAEAERPVTSAPPEEEYPGPVVCQSCPAVIRPARAGYEKKPPLTGVCSPCEAQWRRDNGLPPRRDSR